MSDWTIDSLKEHYDQRFTDQDKAVNAALQAAKEAVIKAETAADKRFELLNELREGVATHEQLEAVEKVVDDLKTRLDTGTGRTAGYSGSWGIFLAIATLVVAVLYLILRSKS